MTKEKRTKLYVKMVNMNKSIGIQVEYKNLVNLEDFLTNFN